MTDEEKAQRKRDIANKYRDENYEYVRLQKRIWLDRKYELRLNDK